MSYLWLLTSSSQSERVERSGPVTSKDKARAARPENGAENGEPRDPGAARELGALPIALLTSRITKSAIEEGEEAEQDAGHNAQRRILKDVTQHGSEPGNVG